MNKVILFNDAVQGYSEMWYSGSPKEWLPCFLSGTIRDSESSARGHFVFNKFKVKTSDMEYIEIVNKHYKDKKCPKYIRDILDEYNLNEK